MEIPICKILKKVMSSLVWPLDKNKSLFLGVNTKAVTTNVLRICKEAGLKKRSFKSSRHFAAIQLTNRRIPIEVVWEFMVHQSINTTNVKTGTLKSEADALADSRGLLFEIIRVL